jgi:hypothetical protein
MKHPLVPPHVRERIEKFSNILSEVETHTVEERCETYLSESDPEWNLQIWEQIAEAYKIIINEHTTFSIEEKRAVYALLLRLTMGMDPVSPDGLLTQENMDWMRGVFSATVLKVIEKMA